MSLYYRWLSIRLDELSQVEYTEEEEEEEEEAVFEEFQFYFFKFPYNSESVFKVSVA